MVSFASTRVFQNLQAMGRVEIRADPGQRGDAAQSNVGWDGCFRSNRKLRQRGQSADIVLGMRLRINKMRARRLCCLFAMEFVVRYVLYRFS